MCSPAPPQHFTTAITGNTTTLSQIQHCRRPHRHYWCCHTHDYSHEKDACPRPDMTLPGCGLKDVGSYRLCSPRFQYHAVMFLLGTRQRVLESGKNIPSCHCIVPCWADSKSLFGSAMATSTAASFEYVHVCTAHHGPRKASCFSLLAPQNNLLHQNLTLKQDN